MQKTWLPAFAILAGITFGPAGCFGRPSDSPSPEEKTPETVEEVMEDPAQAEAAANANPMP